MRNLFKRKKAKETVYLELPLSLFARQAVFDTAYSDPQSLSLLLGMPPMSEDVAAMEQEASTERMADISPIHPVLIFHASVIGELSSRFHKFIVDPVEEVSEEELAQLEKVYTTVALAATSSLLSVLYSHHLIDIIAGNPFLISACDHE